MAEVDVIVVGSGFGGAVAAARLSEAGRSVLILERGRAWTPEEYPRVPGDAWIWDQKRPERHNGWIDLRILDDMWVAQGAGVGGGSLIYANVSIDADASVFASGWPSAISYDALKPFYEKVADILGSRQIPDGQTTERFKLMKEAAERLGVGNRFRKVDLAINFDDEWSYSLEDAMNENRSKWTENRFKRRQGTCYHCGNCDLGCKVQARNSLDLNYLAIAQDAGAVIKPLCLVTHISQADGHWTVHYDELGAGQRVPRTVSARRVVLAAGSLGSTEILLRSRDQYGTLPNLPASLGKGWSSNGDFLTPAFYKGRRIAPTEGPTISCAIDFLDGTQGGRFFVEDGGFPNIIKNFLAARKSHLGLFRRMAGLSRRLRTAINDWDLTESMMPWFGQGIDGANGTLYLGRRLRAPWQRVLALDWDSERSEVAINGLIAMHKKLSEATGGEAVVPLSYTVFRNLVTPHPLGGCGMAASPAAGVVDHFGNVFGHSGLHVLDGSILPRAIGLNPSKTIAALSERGVADILTREALGGSAALV